MWWRPLPATRGAAGWVAAVSRRQALGRMSALATAGAAAWVAPQILTAKPAAGASLSTPPGSSGSTTGSSTAGNTGSGVSTSSGTATLGSTGGTTDTGSTSAGSGDDLSGVATSAQSPETGALAYTGVDLERDAAIGAGLIASGWALQRWASRTARTAVDGGTPEGSR